MNIFLNEIPAKGQVDILLSAIHSLVSHKVELSNPSLQVGSQSIASPVTMQSGQYIELESVEDCVLYDERGELLQRFRPQADTFPNLAHGSIGAASGEAAYLDTPTLAIGIVLDFENASSDQVRVLVKTAKVY